MLRSLNVRNYILIDSLEVDFPEGLVIITGQTGAGKSILLGALSLVSGAKADAAVVSEGADNCVVEAEFVCDDPAVKAILEENDIEWDDGGLTVRRVVSRTGRSRSFINDCPVQVSVLSSVADLLVDIHSQHRSLLLTDRSFQLSVLDSYAGNTDLLQECRSEWRRLGALKAELKDLEESRGRIEADRDYNASQFDQLDAARLRDGELEELEAEQQRLANAEQIKESLGVARAQFEPEETHSLDAALKEARRQLERVSAYLPDAAALSQRLESSRIELDDILSAVCDLDSSVSVSPDALEQVEERMSLLYSLMRKHGVSTVAELIALRDSLSGQLFDADALTGRIESLRSEVEAAAKHYGALASRLSDARRKAAPAFAAAVTESLHFLELDRAVFSVGLEPAEPGANGTDSVSFLFAADGRNPREVSKCASGGELSRIMLALKAMMARFTGMPTLIFDEIDTGVSGSVADKMGRMICEMGAMMQVFSITHLPQVAAKGRAHYVVSKAQDPSGRSVTSVRKVEGRERTMEIARLLSGSSITEAAIANAESLLKGC